MDNVVGYNQMFPCCCLDGLGQDMGPCVELFKSIVSLHSTQLSSLTHFLQGFARQHSQVRAKIISFSSVTDSPSTWILIFPLWLRIKYTHTQPENCKILAETVITHLRLEFARRSPKAHYWGLMNSGGCSLNLLDEAANLLELMLWFVFFYLPLSFDLSPPLLCGHWWMAQNFN